MKYSELISFNPIEDVIQLITADVLIKLVNMERPMLCLTW